MQYIDLARAKSEAPFNTVNLQFKSSNKLVIYKSVNFRAHSCDFLGKDEVILEKNNLQTVQEWNKSYMELIALYVHPQNSNHLRLQSRAIMALDHSQRLGLENKFFPNLVVHLHHLYFIRLTEHARYIILCSKDRLQDTIVLGGSQFIRCNL